MLSETIRLDRSFTNLEILAPPLSVATIAAVDIVWLSSIDLRITGLGTILGSIFILTLISSFYGFSGRSKSLFDMSYYGALWGMTVLTGGCLSYIFATMNLPLQDETFNRFDLAMGFDWLKYYAYLQGHPWQSNILMVAYYSGLPQIFISIMLFSLIGRTDRNDELWWTSLIALMLTSVLSGLFPAAGTFHHFGVGLENAGHLPDLFSLRDGSVTEYIFGDMTGIITFPSYHTVVAFLLIYVHRSTSQFLFVTALNVLMLIATPIFGGHYLADMIAGGVVAVAAILITRLVRTSLAATKYNNTRGN